MPSREEIAAKVAKEFQTLAHKAWMKYSDEMWSQYAYTPADLNYETWMAAWKVSGDALISAKVELAEREQKLERYKNALHGHLCANDAADWIACKYGSHFGESGEIYCDVCAGESPDPEHPHPMLRKVTEKLADSEQRVKELSEALRMLPLESFEGEIGSHDAAEFVDHAGEFFAAMDRAWAVLSEG